MRAMFVCLALFSALFVPFDFMRGHFGWLLLDLACVLFNGLAAVVWGDHRSDLVR